MEIAGVIVPKYGLLLVDFYIFLAFEGIFDFLNPLDFLFSIADIIENFAFADASRHEEVILVDLYGS